MQLRFKRCMRELSADSVLHPRTFGRRTSELIRIIREARKPSVGCCLGAAGIARRTAAVCESAPGWKAAAGATCRDNASASAPVITHVEWSSIFF